MFYFSVSQVYPPINIEPDIDTANLAHSSGSILHHSDSYSGANAEGEGATSTGADHSNTEYPTQHTNLETTSDWGSIVSIASFPIDDAQNSQGNLNILKNL